MIARRGLILLLLAVSAGCGPTPAQSGLDRVRRAGVLRWGADVQGGEPFAFHHPTTGALVGFEVEIAEALARELGVKAVFAQNDWTTLVPSLERGSFDVALNGLEVTPSRSQRVRFSRPYYVFAERLVARAGDDRIRTLASLRGLRVGTLANSLAWDLLGEAGAIAVPYEGVEEPFIDLASGRVDAVLIDDIIVDRYGKRPGLAVVGDVAMGQYAIGVRRDEGELFAAVDAALARLLRSGELRRILARWKLDGPRQGLLDTASAPGGADVGARTARALTGNEIGLFLEGALITLLVSVGAMAIAVLGGMALAVARLPSWRPWRRVLGAVATAYVEIFRGTPVLLQLYVLYYGLAPLLALDAFSAAVIGLGLNYAAYEAEIYRAGIGAVPRGEIEAAQALGMSSRMAFQRVVLPQALRFSLPGMTNDFIALLKDSSLVSVITVVELTKRMTITAVDIGSWIVPGMLCAALYFAMSYPLSRFARRLEHRLTVGARR